MRETSNVRDELFSLLEPNDDRASFRPSIYDLSNVADRQQVKELLAANAVVVHDTLEAQLDELVCTLDPGRELDRAERQARILRHLAGCELLAYGRWVHYPWSRRLVHTLPAEEHFILRSDRNRYKISLPDQRRLRAFTIGVVGLSVGQASAITLAMEGVGGRFRLADFDELSISNMNRIRAGIHEIGVPKTVVAARAMYEIDPYLSIEVFSAGLTPDNAERFIVQGGKLDLIVEECDDLQTKLSLRERARGHGIPVIMETSDRGMLDIERFDREPDRPILHGLVGGLSADALTNLSTKDKVPYVLRILDEKRISDAFAASLVEVKESIYTWPQLASAIALGGALVTDAARRLLLGELQDSGRFYVDFESLVANGQAVDLASVAVDEPSAPVEEPISLPGGRSERLSHEDARFLVAHAGLAPSGGNQQPWRFEFHGQTCRCFLDESRIGSFLDYDDAASVLAVGAASENMVIAAAALGWAARVEPFPDRAQPGLVARVEFARSGSTGDPTALERLRARVTNRRLGQRTPLSEADQSALVTAAEAADVHLRLITDPAHMRQIAHVLGRCDRLRFLSRTMHRDLMGELRFTDAEARASRTGIDLPSLELTRADEAAMRVLSRWQAMERVKAFGGGKALERPAEKAIAASAAVGLISRASLDRAAHFDGGRGVQRVWLEATARKLAFQPYSSLVYLLARLERGCGAGLSDVEQAALSDLRQELEVALPRLAGHTELLLFRLAYADEPSSRALRLPVDDVFRFMA